MLRLLDRYILRDLLRTLLLTAGVLATVVAFGAAIKPLSDDQLLTASQAARYIVLAMVPMLQFAIPFSAGFAATLVGHRMSSDNEVLAISAGGISYRRLLVPVVALGLGLLVIMVGLTQWTIPRFWGLMQRTISADVTRLFESSISRGEPFSIGNLQIYADDMAVEEDPSDTDADARMVLLRVVAAELDDERRIVTDVSAGRAEVYIYRRPEGTYLKLVMIDTVAFNSSTGQLARTDQVSPSRAIRLGASLEDDPMTMTRPQLRRLAEDPDGFTDVVQARDELIASIRDARARRWLDDRLHAEGRIELVRAGIEGRSYRVEADALDGRFLARTDRGPIVVEELHDGAVVRRFLAARAQLSRAVTSQLSDPRFELVLTNCTVESGDGATNRRAEVEIPDLLIPARGDDGLTGLASPDLIVEARNDAAGNATVERRAARLDEEITELRAEIGSRLQKRYALCLTAPLVLLLGAILAMWRRESLPLTVYLWAFIPSILDLIVISGGEQMLRDGRPEGLYVLWSGNAILFGLCSFAYYKLSRH